jgi:hypothetical protein
MSNQPVARPPGWDGRSGVPVWPAYAAPRLTVPQPNRPVYREPLPVRAGRLSLGLAGGGAWMLLVGAQAGSVRGFALLTLVAAAVASGIVGTLLRVGDRGVAVGVALAAGAGVSTAAVVVGVRWMLTGDWPLW